MFRKVLIANRGAIAVRIARTLRELGIASVAVYAESDRDSLHIDAADEAFSLGPGPAASTYNDQDKLLAIIAQSGCDAVHPGYGFLSENAQWAERLAESGVTFIGPSATQLSQFGLKHIARTLAQSAGVSLLPGSGLLTAADDALVAAAEIGYPVMLKSSAGGGGIGMQRCADDAELEAAFAQVQRLAQASFGDARVFLERCVDEPRHVEVQAFGDGQGAIAILGDRDCSLQRRHQKVIEECPAPDLPAEVRARIHDEARRLLAQVQYQSAGTVEFLYDPKRQDAYFLEVNTRLQVEHGVTEMVFGVDLVAWMVAQAAGELGPLNSLVEGLAPQGHAVQARLYAEDPARDFRPAPGEITSVRFGSPAAEAGVRVEMNEAAETVTRIDSWIQDGTVVSPFFDPMLGKIIVHAPTRTTAIAQLGAVLASSAIFGIQTNREFLHAALNLPAFLSSTMHNQTLAGVRVPIQGVEVLAPGPHTTVQAWPGRTGLWPVGVPPSGPMDSLSFRLGNRLLNNLSVAAGLEFTLSGPTLRFGTATTCVVCGASSEVWVDDELVAQWQPLTVPAGATLRVGQVQNGARGYILFAGGIAGVDVLGSQATFTLAKFGGHGGRALLAGDILPLHPRQARVATRPSSPGDNPGTPDWLASRTALRVTLGPHGAPDFLTAEGLDEVLQATWEVHYHSSRTGVRLVGPSPQWARENGGEAGLHPSNIHDTPYAIGAIDFTGDQPVILGPDGPSLGGFVCPATVITADLWKLGQLTAGDVVTLEPVSEADASDAARVQETFIASTEAAARLSVLRSAEKLSSGPSVDRTIVKYPARSKTALWESPVLLQAAYQAVSGAMGAGGWQEARETVVTVRRAGDAWLLVEFGPMVLDIGLRLKVHALAAALRAVALPGIIELTPGIRSLQLHFDLRRWSCRTLTAALEPVLGHMFAALDEFAPTSRIVRLPLSWDDPVCREAAERYTQGVRPDAPWCPDNIEFIRRINGLDSIDAVKKIVFDASYLVMGLGDVYLGAPVATPVNPAHRLVTTKYNPARTWTAENSVGIGGSYLCVYGMEGPGGYQFVGRTLQVWNQHQRGAAFTEPYLLRPFDEIRFTPVSAAELVEIRADFPRGRYELDITESTFRFDEYQAMLAREAPAIAEFTRRREAAFSAELEDWKARGLLRFEADVSAAPQDAELPDGTIVHSPMAGAIWSLAVVAGDRVKAGDTVAIVEAMKTEFPVTAPADGVVTSVLAGAGTQVNSGQALMVLAA